MFIDTEITQIIQNCMNNPATCESVNTEKMTYLGPADFFGTLVH